jgi:hypothetical protein
MSRRVVVTSPGLRVCPVTQAPSCPAPLCWTGTVSMWRAARAAARRWPGHSGYRWARSDGQGLIVTGVVCDITDRGGRAGREDGIMLQSMFVTMAHIALPPSYCQCIMLQPANALHPQHPSCLQTHSACC